MFLSSGSALQRYLTGMHMSTVVSMCSPYAGVESMRLRNFKTHKQRPVLLPVKQQRGSKKLPPNKS